MVDNLGLKTTGKSRNASSALSSVREPFIIGPFCAKILEKIPRPLNETFPEHSRTDVGELCNRIPEVSSLYFTNSKLPWFMCIWPSHLAPYAATAYLSCEHLESPTELYYHT